jgi:hypothetical protein
MKNILLALSLFATATPALAKSPKLVITYTPNGQAAEECKISEKEMAKILEKNSDKGLCTKITAVSPAKEELIPETLAKLISLAKEQQGHLSLAYTGTDGAALNQTVMAWMDFLAKQNKTGLWTATLVSAQNNVGVVQLANAAGEALTLQVILGYEIPKTDEE